MAVRSGDIDPERTVYRAPKGRVVHLRGDCLDLNQTERVRGLRAGVLRGDERVCKGCTGRRTRPITKRCIADELETMSPEDLGLSPMGERP